MDIIELLISHTNKRMAVSEFINMQDRYGRTALEIAQLLNNVESVQLLASHTNKSEDNDSASASALSNTSVPLDFLFLESDAQMKEIAKAEILRNWPLHDGSGGWSTVDSLQELDFNVSLLICNDTLTRDTFIKENLSLRKPVIIRGCYSQEELTQMRDKWSKENFVRKYGHMAFAVGDIPYASTYSKKEHRMTAKEFISLHMSQETEQRAKYIFDGNVASSDLKSGAVFTPSLLNSTLFRTAHVS